MVDCEELETGVDEMNAGELKLGTVGEQWFERLKLCQEMMVSHRLVECEEAAPPFDLTCSAGEPPLCLAVTSPILLIGGLSVI